jgi:hypothetical protein
VTTILRADGSIADDEELLAAAKADLVVTSLDEVDVAGLSEHQLRRRTIEVLTE